MFLYVIEFTDGVVKIGETKNFEKRLSQHKSINESLANRGIIRSFSSECNNLRERDLILFCSQNYTPVHGAEYFSDCDFDLLCKIIESDSKEMASPHELLIVDGLKVCFDKQNNLVNINQVLHYGNEKRREKKLPQKLLASYFDTEETKDLIKKIKWEYNLQESQVKKVINGRSGGTWVHPMIAIDFAMWIDKGVYLKLSASIIKKLNESNNLGDSFKIMNTTLRVKFPNDFENPQNYMRIANAIAKACGVYEIGADKWQLATKEQLELRERIQNLITIYADVVDDLETCVNKAIQKELSKKPIESV